MTPSFWAGRPVLVTGHSGFKGSWLSALLLQLGAEVHGFSDLPPDPAGPFDLATAPGAGTVTTGDVRDFPAVCRAMSAASPDIVFHLAAQPLVRRSYREPVTTFSTNVMGTVHVLQAALDCPTVRSIVVVTTDKCYEIGEGDEPFREDDRLGGHDPYSSSKACCELVAASFRSSFTADGRLRIATARAGNVIGGGDWSADRLIPDLMRAREAGRVTDVRYPDAVRPWQHVLEPLSGYLALAEALAGEHGAEFCSAWNFGPASEDCVPVRRIVTRFAELLGMEWRIVPAPALRETHVLRLDSSKARTVLGWQPRLRIERALDWTADWYRQSASGSERDAVTRDQIERWRTL